tara:strand:+ start:5674 stop:6156 length:483 start_codon:yes stop_codon:yes gene_type:complete
MKKVIVMIFAVAAIATSCKNTKNTETQNSAAQTATAPETKSQDDATSQSSAPEKNSATVTTSTDGNRPALNPAHGEPYHRCDIQVGAPLDSPAPVQPAAPQVIPQQASVSNNFNTNPIAPSAAPAPSVSSTSSLGPKPALNPPHGEPHHRCDLQVGAPLT